MILYADDFFVYTTVLKQKTGLCFNILGLDLLDAQRNLLFTISSGGKMTSCVGSIGAKSSALNKDVTS